MFRVPLVLQTSLAVIYRLNLMAISESEPYSGGTGYNKSYREPIVFDASRQGKTVREYARSELPPIKVPCQVETGSFERLRQGVDGDVPDSSMVLVVHRQDLTVMKLIDSETKDLLINVNDRVSHIESSQIPGVITQKFEGEGMFITSIAPASWGFGPDGFDLYLFSLEERQKGRA